MFGKMPGEEELTGHRENHEPSFLQVAVRVRGEIEAEGDLRIDGVLQGSVTVGRTLVLGTQSQVDGLIAGREIIVQGRFKGVAIAESRIRLGKGARVQADLYCGGLVIEDEVFFFGRSHMGEEIPDRQRAREAVQRRLDSPEPNERAKTAFGLDRDPAPKRLTLIAGHEYPANAVQKCEDEGLPPTSSQGTAAPALAKLD